MCYINDSNRGFLQARYINSIIANLDFMQVRGLLGVYLDSEKSYYTNEELEDEIKARGLWWEVCEPIISMEMTEDFLEMEVDHA